MLRNDYRVKHSSHPRTISRTMAEFLSSHKILEKSTCKEKVNLLTTIQKRPN